MQSASAFRQSTPSANSKTEEPVTPTQGYHSMTRTSTLRDHNNCKAVAWRRALQKRSLTRIYCAIVKPTQLARHSTPSAAAMKLSMQFAILASAWSTQMRVAETANVGTDTTIFSSAFVQPAPPKIQPEFKASWNQHKWLDLITLSPVRGSNSLTGTKMSLTSLPGTSTRHRETTWSESTRLMI